MSVTVNTLAKQAPFYELAPGQPFAFAGFCYVKTRPTERRDQKFNAFGLGHDGTALVPHDHPVALLDVVLSEVPA